MTFSIVGRKMALLFWAASLMLCLNSRDWAVYEGQRFT